VVARIVSGKNIRGVLNYNENKIASGEAELLAAAGFPYPADQLSFRNKLAWFERLTMQNLHTRTNALHITLNFSRSDVLENELLITMARDYMERIGFGDQPFLVYRHYDAAHPHIHIATVNIAEGGERIETHNIGRNQSEKARKEMEVFYNLIRAEDQQKEGGYLLRPAKLEAAAYGRSETKAAISSIVREVTGSYKFTSLGELNAALRQFNVMANPRAEGSRMREKGGLVYCLLDENGETVGVPIKASSIFSSPTIKNLEKKYKPNESARRPYGLRLKHQLDKALANAQNLQQLEGQISSQGIRILIRRNSMGNIYGITFIDNATRVVFNGGDLGKGYAAKAFTEKLERRFGNFDLHQKQPDDRQPDLKNEAMDYPAQEQRAVTIIHDHPLSIGKDQESKARERRIKKGLQPE
jgi:hypothetical protein